MKVVHSEIEPSVILDTVDIGDVFMIGSTVFIKGCYETRRAGLIQCTQLANGNYRSFSDSTRVIHKPDAVLTI